MVPNDWQEYIRKAVKENKDSVLLSSEIHHHCTAYYKDDGFSFWQEAERVFVEFMIACQIRTYCRRNRLTTKKGSMHCLDCRREHFVLWTIVTKGSMDGNTDNIHWQYRTVDGLKNLYIWF